ncbi:MAG TPA: hypothetical protein PLV64_24810 [Anaerolineales bacterium]|nr:hypothetical protein [Anaerolineales bacterium]
MSRVGPEGRSYLPIEMADLYRLLEIAKQDREAFFYTHPEWRKYYSQRVIGVALCQGAAKHYVDGSTGINDFDVYTFYRKHPQRNWYAKRIKSYDFGDKKFGKSVDKPDFIGRRVDCLSRSIEVKKEEDIQTALRRYLTEGKTETAKLLAAKAVVLLEPACGEIIWPPSVSRRKTL